MNEGLKRRIGYGLIIFMVALSAVSLFYGRIISPLFLVAVVYFGSLLARRKRVEWFFYRSVGWKERAALTFIVVLIVAIHLLTDVSIPWDIWLEIP